MSVVNQNPGGKCDCDGCKANIEEPSIGRCSCGEKMCCAAPYECACVCHKKPTATGKEAVKPICLCGDASCKNGDGKRPTCFWYCENSKHAKNLDPSKNRIPVASLYEWYGDRMACEACLTFCECVGCSGDHKPAESAEECPCCDKIIKHSCQTNGCDHIHVDGSMVFRACQDCDEKNLYDECAECEKSAK